MSPEQDIKRGAEALDQAADWLVRIQSDDASDEDWAGLQAWLDAAPAHSVAFAAAEALWLELDGLPEAARARLGAEGGDRPAELALARGRRRRALPWAPVAAAAAAAAALAILVPWRQFSAPPPETYAVAKGENRLVRLADGSTVHLNTGSTIRVRLERDSRQVELVGTDAEAAFDVAKDPARPFVIAAGASRIRVVGTAFNVRRGADRLAVTVERGVVEVAARGGDDPVRLTPGSQLVYREAERRSVVTQVDPAIALAWRNRELIYRDQRLADVVEDLNRYFARPVTVVGPAAALPFTGALKVDDEDAVVRRLEAFLPIASRASPHGVVLSQRPQTP